MKGKYTVATFSAPAEGFRPLSFLDGIAQPLENLREHMVMRTGKPGLIVCREDTANLNLNYLPSLFSLEEIAPFFRLPALYDGETIQLPKETAPPSVGKTNSLTFGQDKTAIRSISRCRCCRSTRLFPAYPAPAKPTPCT